MAGSNNQPPIACGYYKGKNLLIMNANNINANLHKKTELLRQYMSDVFPRMAANKTKRFIDGNFRAQGFQGSTFQTWPKKMGKGRILLRTGNLRRSIHAEVAPGTARIYTNAPYAGVHNRGFKGAVNVKAHTRNRYTATQVGTGRFTKGGVERTKTVHTLSGSGQVKAHQRQMNIPKRQFMPESISDSPVLMNAIRRDVINNIKAIFQ
jgi:phage gpG-like protein